MDGVITATNQDGTGGNLNMDLPTRLTSNNYGYRIEGLLGLHYSWVASTRTQLSANMNIELGSEIPVVSTLGFPDSGWIRIRMQHQFGPTAPPDVPVYMKYISKTDTSFQLSGEDGEWPEQVGQFVTLPQLVGDDYLVEMVNFIDEYTTGSSRDAADEIISYPYVDGFAEIPHPSVFAQYFVLSEMTINPSHSINDVSIIDIREDGGGIKTDRYDEAKNTNPEAQWFDGCSQFNGQPYPGNAVSVVKLPYSILDRFTLDNIRSIVSENINYGPVPLIRFYGYQPRVTAVVPTLNGLAVQWEKEGPEFSYQVWYSVSSEGPWILANKTRMVDDPVNSVNQYLINGLNPNVQYYTRVTMTDRYYMWWHSYTSYDSIEGGLGLDEDPPSPPFGNVCHFQFQIPEGA